MFHCLLFLVSFLIIYFIFKLVLEDGLKRDKKNVKEIAIAKKLFKLDEGKIDNKELLNGVAIINSFIISITFVVVDIIGLENIYWLVIALALIIALIFVCYSIYGKILHKKWGKEKNDKEL